MKIVWLCASVPEAVSKQYVITVRKPESWITGIYSILKNRDEFQILFLVPERMSGRKIDWMDGNTHYLSYPEHNTGYENAVEQYFETLLLNEKPDCIHIFGTEGGRTLAMVKAGEKTGYLNRTIIHVQGLVSVIAKHYLVGLPHRVIYGWTLRDLLRLDNIYFAQRGYVQRGKLESESLQLARHVMGRTDWDYACTKMINDRVSYHYCGEMLRESFYNAKWSLSHCQRHTVFVTQSAYPVKGFHLMLEALHLLKRKYPDIQLVTTGQNPLHYTWKQKLLQTSYSKYIAALIRKYQLQDHVTFCGMLSEQEICDQLLRAHVFVCSSTIENSSNSIGEAMMLGMPIVASDVGGIKSMLVHEHEGLLYQADAPYMLAACIDRLFSNDDEATEIGEHAAERGKKQYDRSRIINDLLQIYDELAKKDVRIE